jgi:hypothetical protein
MSESRKFLVAVAVGALLYALIASANPRDVAVPAAAAVQPPEPERT